jgi:hypothetical protein
MHPHQPPDEFLLRFFGGVAALFVVTALLRRAQGLPFFKPKVDGVEHAENWLSGRTSRGLIGVLSGANNCLWFILTSDTVRVGAHFPFNMFFPPFLLRFDLEIPVGAITSVEEKSKFLMGKWLRIAYEYPDRDGRTKSGWVELRPRNGEGLARALGEKARAAREGRPFS